MITGQLRWRNAVTFFYFGRWTFEYHTLENYRQLILQIYHFFNLVIYMNSDVQTWKLNAQTRFVCPVNLHACCIWHNQTYLIKFVTGWSKINAVKTHLILLHTIQIHMWRKLNFNAACKKGHAQLKKTHTHFTCRNFCHGIYLPKGQEKF
jgi:hypothetical protein